MRNDEGSELVEFAVVIPVILMLLIGVFEFGRAWHTREAIDRAAREGAREIVLTPCALCEGGMYTSEEVKTRFVDPALRVASLDPSRVHGYYAKYVFLDQIKSQCGVELGFSYPMNLMVPFLPKNAMSLELGTKVRMRLENQIGLAGCSGDL